MPAIMSDRGTSGKRITVHPTERLHAKIPHLRPILMTFRSLEPRLRTYDLEQFALSGRVTAIDSRRTVELVRKRQVARGVYSVHLYLDAERDFVILREVNIEDGVVHLQLDIEYEENKHAGWQPRAWRIRRTHPDGSGLPYESTDATVVQAELNAEIPASTFDIDFPVGTYVMDDGGDGWYIVTSSGKRLVPPSEIGKTYAELVNTAPDLTPSLFMGWPTIGALVLIAACVVLLLWRRLAVRAS